MRTKKDKRQYCVEEGCKLPACPDCFRCEAHENEYYANTAWGRTITDTGRQTPQYKLD